MFFSRNHIFILVFIAAFLITNLLMPAVFFVGKKLNLVDQPGHRKIHDQPIYRCGGLSIFFGFWITILLGIFILYYLNTPELPTNISRLAVINTKYIKAFHTLTGLFLGSACIYAIGFLDDKYSPKFSAKVKLFLQILVVAFVVYFYKVRSLFLPHVLPDVILSVIWIVGITNSFNLLDNMNGLAAGVAFICCVFLCWLAIAQSQYYIALATLVLMGCLLGFLPYNFPKAKVFLGDQGSLVIGFLLASLTVMESYISPSKSETHFEILMPLFTLALPIFDTFSVIIIRLKEHRPIYVGDTSHLSHRLVDLGLTRMQSVIVLYLLTALFAMNAILLIDTPLFVGVLSVVQNIFMIVIISVLMIYGKKNKTFSSP